MERILDKTIVLAGCLLTAACFLVETSSGAEPAASDARLLTLAIAMLIAVYAPRSPKPSRHPRAYWPFRHTARRRASFPLRSPSYRLPSMTARAASIARTFCVSRARSPLSRLSHALCARRCRRFRRHRFFALQPRPAFSRFARAQRSPASASPGARGTHWPPRRFHFARGIATFEIRSIGCRR